MRVNPETEQSIINTLKGMIDVHGIRAVVVMLSKALMYKATFYDEKTVHAEALTILACDLEKPSRKVDRMKQDATESRARRVVQRGV